MERGIDAAPMLEHHRGRPFMDIETTNPVAGALDRLLSDRFSCRGFLSRPVPGPRRRRSRCAHTCRRKPWALSSLKQVRRRD